MRKARSLLEREEDRSPQGVRCTPQSPATLVRRQRVDGIEGRRVGPWTASRKPLLGQHILTGRADGRRRGRTDAAEAAAPNSTGHGDRRGSRRRRRRAFAMYSSPATTPAPWHLDADSVTDDSLSSDPNSLLSQTSTGALTRPARPSRSRPRAQNRRRGLRERVPSPVSTTPSFDTEEAIHGVLHLRRR